MEHTDRVSTEAVSPDRAAVHAAFVVSAQSAVWSVVASIVSIGLGLHSHTSVLVAFGAIGFVDAIGSIALVYHFHHGLRHDRLSERLESLAHRIVLVGLFVVGSAAVIGGVVRLFAGGSSEASDAGVIVAAVSLVVLTILSARKQMLARRVSSNALRSDGHLSAIGAMQAAITMLGTAATRWLDWSWADAAATAVVGCVAATLAVVTWRAEARH
jgi:divalent metal cation (Fe/Co/Zn/Cd) transporter